MPARLTQHPPKTRLDLAAALEHVTHAFHHPYFGARIAAIMKEAEAFYVGRVVTLRAYDDRQKLARVCRVEAVCYCERVSEDRSPIHVHLWVPKAGGSGARYWDPEWCRAYYPVNNPQLTWHLPGEEPKVGTWS